MRNTNSKDQDSKSAAIY